jgi:hypothetical protein
MGLSFALVFTVVTVVEPQIEVNPCSAGVTSLETRMGGFT